MGSVVARDLQHALEAKAKQPELVPYGGGTDLMVTAAAVDYLFLHQVVEINQITEDDHWLIYGAGCSFTSVADYPGTPDILKQAIDYLAAPAIRNFGTLGGNVGNGSAKADTSLIFYVFDAVVVLQSTAGERLVPIADLYLGRKKLDLKPSELITHIRIPKANYGHYYYKKIGARKALAISRLDIAAVYRIENDVIKHFSVAIGAIMPTIVRRADFDAMLIDLTLEEAKAKRASYLAQYDAFIQPIDGRVSAFYRRTVSLNLLNDVLDTMGL